MSVNVFTLRDLLVGALVGASTDATIPTLRAVQVSWSDGRIVVASTDRYRLVIGESDRPTVSGAATVLVSREHVESLVKALPKTRVRNGHAVLSVNDPVVTLHRVSDQVLVVRVDDPVNGSWSRELPLLDGSFPKWESLVPSEFKGTDAIAWNPAYLADVAKLPHDGNVPVSFKLQESTRPALASYSQSKTGVSWRYLLMPVKLT